MKVRPGDDDAIDPIDGLRVAAEANIAQARINAKVRLSPWLIERVEDEEAEE